MMIKLNTFTTASLLTCFVVAHTDAAIVTGINIQPGTAGGVSVDTTGGAYATWGYASDALVSAPTFDNVKAGTTAPTFSHNGLTSSSRDFGHRFTFDDGTSPTSGANVVTNGAAANLPLDRTWSFLFEDIVTTTESTLTLYIGGWATGSTGVDIDATLTGGTSDEAGDQRSYLINGTTTSNGINSGVYTVTFSSATETDLLIEFAATAPQTGGRNIGVSGYTLEVIPEPSSLALIGLGGLCLIRRRR